MRPSGIIAALISAVFFAALVFAPGAAAAGPKELAKARADAAAAAYATASTKHASGQGTAEAVYTWSARWFVAQRDQPLKGKALVAAARAHLDRMTDLESAVSKGVAAGTASASDLEAAVYYRVEAELWVARKGK